MTAAAYCRRCSYPLVGLPSRRCPECGRAFDPADRRSFDRSPRRRTLRRLGRWAVPLVMVLVLLASPVVWVYAGWQAERAAIQAGGNRLSVSAGRQIGPVWAAKLLGEHAFWLDRATTVALHAPHGDPVWNTLSAFRYLESVELGGNRRDTASEHWPNDDDLRPLGTYTHLRRLTLDHANCTDATLRAMTRTCDLEYVTFDSLPRMTDNGLAALGPAVKLWKLVLKSVPVSSDGISWLNLPAKPELSVVEIDHANVGDRGVRLITALPKLQNLSLASVPISDAALVGIGHARCLEILYLQDAAITGSTFDSLTGLDKLKALAVVECHITDAGLSRLPVLPALQAAAVSGNDITATGLDTLGQQPYLRVLDVTEVPRRPGLDEHLRNTLPHVVLQRIP